MTVSRIITNKAELDSLIALLGARKLPITVAVKDGKHRTNNQNSLQRKWLVEAAQQLGDETAEEKRGYCKLHFGVPILRNESAEFRAEYDAVIRPLSYESKLKLMQDPFDFRVTSLMNSKQKSKYLDAVHQHFTSKGVQLTNPEERK